jgi:hypothetical protein
MRAPCPRCAAGEPCVLHDPLFAELRELPGVPAGPARPVHLTPEEPPFFRKRRRRPGRALEQEVERLRDQVARLSQHLGLGAEASP